MSNQNEETKRKKYEIELEKPVDLPAIAKTAYLSSNDLCKMVSELFKAAFADFEGCFFDATNGEPSVSLLFNHGKYDEDAVTACERVGGKMSGSSLIDRTRNRDRQMIEGDRYYLTEDGKDVISTLLTGRAFNNGNPNWKMLVSEWQDRSVSTMYNYGQTPQYTKVSNISLQRLCSLIFGKKNEDNDYVEYDVRVTMPLTAMGYPQNMNMNKNYLLTITVVSSNEVAKVYEKLGLGTVGAHIIR